MKASCLTVSAIVLIGVLGTLLSTVQTLPHLAAALRTRVPSGSALGWTLSLAGTSMWGLDGLLTHNYWLAGPTLVTFPVFSVLSLWCWRGMSAAHGERPTRELPVPPTLDLSLAAAFDGASAVSPDTSLDRMPARSFRLAETRPYRLDDTLELPRLLGV